MDDQGKVEFIIRYLGVAGACATLRVTKAKMQMLRTGSPLTLSTNRYANKVILNIYDILNNKPSVSYVEQYFRWHHGSTLEDIHALNPKIPKATTLSLMQSSNGI